MRIGITLTLLLTFSCGSQLHIEKVEGKQIAVADNITGKADIEAFIQPYRSNIDKEMNTILAFAPETLDKSGEWQSTIGNMMADAALEKANAVFKLREKKEVDLSLLNFGGIRSILPKGNVTTRNAFEIMPFENSLVVAAMKGEHILEMVSYIIAEKKAHPVAGITFTIGKDNLAKNILIKGKPLESKKIYYVVTSDYLINGGDKMDFFKKAVTTYELDYKLRNVLIDYFKEIKTIPVLKDIRISKE
ncbi:MAG TPA: 5'-nucleotidase [Flavobacterium sp.]